MQHFTCSNKYQCFCVMNDPRSASTVMRNISALDGVRSLAVIFVMIFHSQAPVFKGGFLGLDIFFVLSGFLITSILLSEISRTGEIRLRRFYWHRLMRLTPPLFLLVILYLLVAPQLWPDYGGHLRDAGLALAYLGDYGRAIWHVPNMLRHTWSLAVEAHFYLVWPFILIVISRFSDKIPLITGLVALYLLATTWRLYGWVSGQEWAMVYYRFDTRLSGLVLGALVAAMFYQRKKIAIRMGFILIALLAPLFFVAKFRWGDMAQLQIGISGMELATVLVIIAIMKRSRLVGWLGSAPMAYIGRISYGLYLFHYPAMLYLREEYDWKFALLGGSVFAFAMAAFSYHTVEAMIRRWRLKLSSKG